MGMIADASESIDRTVAIARVLAAPRSAVYHAFVAPEAFSRWMGPEGVRVIECDYEARAGRKYRAVLSDAAGRRHAISGEFREVVPDERLVFSWSMEAGGHVSAPTIVTVEFHDHKRGTEVVLTQSVFGTLEGRDHHARYWEGSLDCLANHLS